MIKNKITLRNISLFLALSLVSQIIFPTAAFALTGGPSQPEVQSFEPIGTNQMVDPFTGDFTYNIPLMDVGGYPINISYHSGITMDQEASWVGLGWNINPGVINRNMRGLPDDFNGDEVESEFNMKENRTFSINSNAGIEIFGLEADQLGLDLNFGFGINYNTYEGVGVDLTAGLSASVGFEKGGTEYGTAGLGMNFVSGSNSGLSINPSVSYSLMMGEKMNNLGAGSLSSSLGASFNSREGLKSYSLGLTATENHDPSPDNKHSSSWGVGGSMSLTPSTYVPQQKFPFLSFNTSGSFKLGGEVFGTDATADVMGAYSVQRLMRQQKSTKAFGYLYSENSLDKKESMMDFNREKERSFSEHTTNLPLTNFTYDIYSVAGQGIGGMFRSHRSDVGYVRDPFVRNVSGSANAGVELGLGNAVKGGANVRLNAVNSESGMWESNNPAKSISFSGRTQDDIREPSYFKMVGEHNTNSVDVPNGSKSDWWKSSVKGSSPAQVPLTGSGGGVATTQKLKSNGSETSVSSIVRSNRAKRLQYVGSLTKKELYELPYYAGKEDIDNLISLNSDYVKDHHIGQLKVVKPDGARYIYGLPAYNYQMKDVSFNISGKNGKDCNKGLIGYDDNDASVENDRGKDQFYQSTKTPAYAHSYLLTTVLSADYSDYDMIPGPSDGDLGNYVKFEYSTVDNYKWRVPVEEYKAAYSEGLKSLASDDMANYSYGEKELKYLDSIVSKTHVAVFHKSKRQDGRGVKGESGGVASGAAYMKQLDKISLFTKAEYKKHKDDLSVATPLKEVHFKYSYKLCPGVPNNANGGGKLTLDKLYFTYGKSYRAKMNSYEFTYADLDHNGVDDDGANPSYNLKGYDRWGSYKPNNGGCGINDPIPAFEYPYTDQDSSLVKVYKSAWNLTDIDLPSGGKIEIDYESDDYAYVQDKRAMQMMKIVGAAKNVSDFVAPNTGNMLYDGKTPYEYLFIATPDAVSSDTKSDLINKYFHGMLGEYMFFKFLMNLSNSSGAYDWEYVPGYCKVLDVGFVGSVGSGKDYAYIKIEKVKTGDPTNNSANANPISVASWNFARKYNTNLAYSVKPNNNASKPGEPNIEDLFVELLDATKNLSDFISGPNGALRVRNFGRRFVLGKSWVRATNPTHRKYGGGVRVKRIKLKDSWDEMAPSGEESAYGQEYSYKLEDGTSSGVAAYEPLIGGEENPFRQPVFFSEARILAPADEYYMEEPFGESFFPAPSVGYSRVVVRNLQHKDILKGSNLRTANKHSTGKTIHEFFTSKDFPTRVGQTSLQVKHTPPSFLSSMLKFSVKDYMNTSQGYVIEKNDMHGKPKAKWIYAQGEEQYQSGVKYDYKIVNGKVNNQVPVLFPDNTISEDIELGVDYDLVNDFRHSQTTSHSTGTNINTDMFMAGVFPIVVPIILGAYNKSLNRYRSVVSTKVVNRFAIQTKTTAYNNESKIETDNLLWDAETGEVIVTSVNNHYDDILYNVNIPAHLAYSGMQGAYKNEGYVLEDITLGFTDPFIDDNNPKFEHFHEGDEVLVYPSTGNPLQAWVIMGETETTKSYYLIDEDGNAIPGEQGNNWPAEEVNYELDGSTVSIKVIRSGHRNVLSPSIGSVTTKSNPIRSDGQEGKLLEVLVADLNLDEVISATKSEFSDKWQEDKHVQEIDGVTVQYRIKDCEYLPANAAKISHVFEKIYSKAAFDDWFDGNDHEVDLSNWLSIAELNDFKEVFRWQGDVVTGPNDHIWMTMKYELPFPINPNLPILLYPAKVFRLGFNLYKNFNPATTPLPAPDESWIERFDGPMMSSTNFVSVDIIHHQGTDWCDNYTYVKNFVVEDPLSNRVGFTVFGLLPVKVHDFVYGPVIQNPGAVNPYVVGMRGNWRNKSVSYFSDTRTYRNNLRKDGELSGVGFWELGANGQMVMNSSGWNKATIITKYDKSGNEVEHLDPLGNYSMALYGYSGSLPIAVAQNAQWGQVLFEGFEDQVYTKVSGSDGGYFDLYDEGTYNPLTNITDEESHTGRFSLEVSQSGSPTMKLWRASHTNFKDIRSGCTDDNLPHLFLSTTCDELNGFSTFSSDDANTYEWLVSYWLKEENQSTPDHENFILGYSYYDEETPQGSPTVVRGVKQVSKPIDGWVQVSQKVKITMPTQTNEEKLEMFFQKNTSNSFFIDDIRFQPVESSMKSFVYDPYTLRLSAQLDENNYATFYEYDEEGNLVRVKKETERGIQTISEHRQNLAKN